MLYLLPNMWSPFYILCTEAYWLQTTTDHAILWLMMVAFLSAQGIVELLNRPDAECGPLLLLFRYLMS